MVNIGYSAFPKAPADSLVSSDSLVSYLGHWLAGPYPTVEKQWILLPQATRPVFECVFEYILLRLRIRLRAGVCMCLIPFVCTRMGTCASVDMHTCECVTSVCLQEWVRACVVVCMYICLCLLVVHLFVLVCLCVYVRVFVYTCGVFVCTQLSLYLYAYSGIFVFVCVCVCVCI